VKDHLIKLIQNNGPMSVADFMRESLFHPKLGYYNCHNPFGKEGDFITAPEISQVFGELIGAYFASAAINAFVDQKVNLVEMGAGSGTLMSDLLRIAIKIPIFFNQTNIHIIEISPRLKAIQQEKLQNYQITWWNDFDSFYKNNSGQPLFFCANELFDCFAINQFVKSGDVWMEKMVNFNGKKLEFVLSNFSYNFQVEAMEGGVLEVSNEAQILMKKLVHDIKNSGGSGLIIDYGYFQNEFRDTLQALKNHQYAEILQEAGNADITALVDFKALENIAQKSGLKTSLVSQKYFLESLGIDQRREKLIAGRNDEEIKKIHSSINRLIGSDQMGELFKCLIFEDYSKR
jgi:NADH dehydrogenase [ubiquinone] 1 alpha subcomplex assembly factor 7